MPLSVVFSTFFSPHLNIFSFHKHLEILEEGKLKKSMAWHSNWHGPCLTFTRPQTPKDSSNWPLLSYVWASTLLLDLCMSYPVMKENLKGREINIYERGSGTGITHMGRGTYAQPVIIQMCLAHLQCQQPHVIVCLVDPSSFFTNNGKKKTDPTNFTN